jgi:nucleoid-associated protein YgaU
VNSVTGAPSGPCFKHTRSSQARRENAFSFISTARTMTTTLLARHSTLAIAAAFAMFAASPATMAQTAPAKPAAKTAKKPAPAKALEPAPASAEQIKAADLVFYGPYQCEANEKIDIVASTKYPSYVDLKHGKAGYVMKPVLSSTGAIRLEDVRGETLMVQIANKSMLLNVKTSQRIVDDCVSSKQRELIEAAKVAKASEGGGLTTTAAPAPTK